EQLKSSRALTAQSGEPLYPDEVARQMDEKGGNEIFSEAANIATEDGSPSQITSGGIDVYKCGLDDDLALQKSTSVNDAAAESTYSPETRRTALDGPDNDSRKLAVNEAIARWDEAMRVYWEMGNCQPRSSLEADAEGKGDSAAGTAREQAGTIQVSQLEREQRQYIRDRAIESRWTHRASKHFQKLRQRLQQRAASSSLLGDAIYLAQIDVGIGESDREIQEVGPFRDSMSINDWSSLGSKPTDGPPLIMTDAENTAVTQKVSSEPQSPNRILSAGDGGEPRIEWVHMSFGDTVLREGARHTSTGQTAPNFIAPTAHQGHIPKAIPDGQLEDFAARSWLNEHRHKRYYDSQRAFPRAWNFTYDVVPYGNRVGTSHEESETGSARLSRPNIAQPLSTILFQGDALRLQEKLYLLWQERPSRRDDFQRVVPDGSEDEHAAPYVPDVWMVLVTRALRLQSLEELQSIVPIAESIVNLHGRGGLKSRIQDVGKIILAQQAKSLRDSGRRYGSVLPALPYTLSEALPASADLFRDSSSSLLQLSGSDDERWYDLDWDPLEFMKDQYGEEAVDVGDVICIIGDVETTLRTVNVAVTGGYGYYTGLLPDGQCLELKTLPGKTRIMIVYQLSHLTMDDDHGKPGTCWHRMFLNPVVIGGFRIPSRTDGEQGLELSLEMMVALGSTPDVTEFAGTTMLKGFNSLFVPTKRIGSSIVWHFIIREGGSRVSYNDGAAVARQDGVIEPSALQTARHFVGWTPVADQLAGSNRSGYTTGWSGIKYAKAPFASLGNLNISISKLVGVSTTFVKGKKDIPVALRGNRSYKDKVKSAGDWTAMFYDSLSRRAWLLDSASALLHISRAWLVSHKSDLNLHALANADEDDGTELLSVLNDIGGFKWPGQFDGRQSALLALYNDYNGRLRLWRNERAETETTRDVETGKVTTNLKTTVTWTRWRDIVEEKYGSLEIMHDHIVRSRYCPTADVKLPFGDRTLEGYEFRDIVSGATPLEPHVTELLPSAGAWPGWCVKSSFIPIFGSDFGELIKPAATSNEQRCGKMSLFPTDLDYLATPVSILASMNGKTHTGEAGCISLGDSATWKDPESSLRKCHCEQGACQVNVARLYTGSVKIRKPGPDIPPEAIWTRYGRGAVIFGDQPAHLSKTRTTPREYVAPSRLRRSRQQICSSSNDAASSSSDASFTDSGVNIDPPGKEYSPS
ncbi:hypothetical protein B0A55_12217, partial [Friedmanniomyces simplex]